MPDLIAYVNDAIQRISGVAAPSISGSHNAGIFNKAANGVEKHVAAYVVSATGRQELAKRTLGQLIPHLERLPGSDEDLSRKAIAGAKEANETWKAVKHGDTPPDEELLLGLRGMLAVLLALPAQPEPPNEALQRTAQKRRRR